MIVIRGFRKIRRVVRRLSNRLRPGVLILVYHRVADLASDPYLLGITPEHFAEHLEVLRQYASVMRLQDLNQALQQGTLPHRAVVVTFDDGYLDNLQNAKPLLERYNIPATVFVTSGFIGRNREFWWDELDRLLLQPGTLPEFLQLTIEGCDYHWSLGDAAQYSQAEQQRDRAWHVYQDHDPTLRHAAFRALHQLLNERSIEQRWQILDQIATWANVELAARPTHRILNADEVQQLAADGLIEVGAHTRSHPVLSALPTVLQQHEIQQSKTDLEAILGHSVTSFAYPHGSRSDYTDQTVAIAQATGFTCACSNFAEMVWSDCDRFQLPRVLVYDWDKAMFAQQLKRWIA